jgi:signal transduction histidine kinase
MDAIYDGSLALISARTEAEVEDIVDRVLTRVSGADRIKFMRPQKGEIVTGPSVSGRDQTAHPQQAVIDGIIESAYSTNERRLIDDLTNTRSATSASAGDTQQYRSVLCEPVGEWGVFVAAHTKKAAFDQATQERIHRLAVGVDAALERIQSGDGHEVSDEALSTIVAHDLRNPLQVATARLEMVRQDCDHEQLSTIARSLSRMDQLIDNLLMSSAEDHLTTELDDVNLSSTVQTSWQNVHTPNATIENQAHGTIRADQELLQQLLENLFGNAIEHVGDSVTVTVGTLESGFYLEDDGQGIPSEKRAAVFDIGFSSTSGGSGLGLAIADQIVDSHGWNMAITDSTGGGARFEIRGVAQV